MLGFTQALTSLPIEQDEAAVLLASNEVDAARQAFRVAEDRPLRAEGHQALAISEGIVELRRYPLHTVHTRAAHAHEAKG